MLILCEVLHRLRIEQFLLNVDGSKFDELWRRLEDLELSILKPDNFNEIQNLWNECKELGTTFTSHLQNFIHQTSEYNTQFRYWSIFLDKLMPVINDLTLSFRESNWLLYLSALQRAIPLFFAFDRTNYSRWVPLYYNDCILLEEKFPDLFEGFMKGDFTVKLSKRKCSAIPVDQALEKEYNKNAKGKGGIIGFTREKEVVAKWNIIKHEKMQYFKFLSDLCNLSGENEYSLHHEYSASAIAEDWIHVTDIYQYLKERVNLFSSTKNDDIVNIATGVIIDSKEKNKLLECIPDGNNAYNNFVKSRFESHQKQLFDVIPKSMGKIFTLSKNKNIDIHQETTKALRYSDFARGRNYDLSSLFKCELSEIPFFLVKDGILRKSDNKSELERALESKLEHVPTKIIPSSDKKSMIVVDFMVCAKKVRIKKDKVKTFGEFCQKVQNMIMNIGKDCQRIDIVFDIYLVNSIKSSARKSRKKSVEPIPMSINRDDQQLPSAIDSFWASESNKEALQMHYIKWFITNYSGEKPIYLGGSLSGDIFGCKKVERGNISDAPNLRCEHEEADDRLMLHIDDAVRAGYERIIIASPDTDIFVTALYHYTKWMYVNLQELWMFCGKGETTRAVPLHETATKLETTLVDVLPALHALTGCDTTSKICSKNTALKIADTNIIENLVTFGKTDLSIDMIIMAEKFLVKCIYSKTNSENFDDLRMEFYHHNNTFNLEKIPPTSTSIHKHIQRAYLQSHIWYSSCFREIPFKDPLDCGYIITEEKLTPDFETAIVPEDFPMPCSCQKCTRDNVCPCRKRKILCCEFCKCQISSSCQNPENVT